MANISTEDVVQVLGRSVDDFLLQELIRTDATTQELRLAVQLATGSTAVSGGQLSSRMRRLLDLCTVAAAEQGMGQRAA